MFSFVVAVLLGGLLLEEVFYDGARRRAVQRLAKASVNLCVEICKCRIEFFLRRLAARWLYWLSDWIVRDVYVVSRCAVCLGNITRPPIIWLFHRPPPVVVPPCSVNKQDRHTPARIRYLSSRIPYRPASSSQVTRWWVAWGAQEGWMQVGLDWGQASGRRETE